MNDEGNIKIFGHLVIRGGMCGDRENARRPEGPGKGIVPNLSQVYLGLTMATLLPFYTAMSEMRYEVTAHTQDNTLRQSGI